MMVKYLVPALIMLDVGLILPPLPGGLLPLLLSD